MTSIKDIVAAKTIKIPFRSLIIINGVTFLAVIGSYVLIKILDHQYTISLDIKDWIAFFDYVSKPMTLVLGGSSIYFAFKTFDANQKKWADEIEVRETKRISDEEKSVAERQENEIIRKKKILEELIPSFHHINSELSNSIFDIDKLVVTWGAYPDGEPKDTLISNVKRQKAILEDRKRKIQTTAFVQLYRQKKSRFVATLDQAMTRNYVAIFELEKFLDADESDLREHLNAFFEEEQDRETM